MSLLPQALINSLRQQQATTLDNYGVDVDLYIVNNLDAIQNLDAYQDVTDKTFTKVTTKAFIDWAPSQHKLRKLGLYTENNLPRTAQFKYDQIISIGSYFNIVLNYPAGTSTETSLDDEFEIVNSSTNGMLGTLIFTTYAIAPRR